MGNSKFMDMGIQDRDTNINASAIPWPPGKLCFWNHFYLQSLDIWGWFWPKPISIEYNYKRTRRICL